MDNPLESHADTPRWHAIEHRLNSFDPGFCRRLAAHAPTLTAMELRVAALVRFSMTSSEIAHLLIISEHSVENYRSVVRKKLGLEQSRSLTTYLSALG